MEKRREKSRDAARSRRTKEADVFNELTSLLPVSEETVATMDKASVMRIAISYVKLRTVLQSKFKIHSILLTSPTPHCNVLFDQFLKLSWNIKQ